MAPSPDRRGVLFAAKTIRPKLPPILVRSYCLDALNRARGSKVLFLSAPASQGKATLALSWLKQTRTKAIWPNLDETDNEGCAWGRRDGSPIAWAEDHAHCSLESRRSTEGS